MSFKIWDNQQKFKNNNFLKVINYKIRLLKSFYRRQNRLNLRINKKKKNETSINIHKKS